MAAALVFALLLIIGIPTYPYWNYLEGPTNSFNARIAGVSMASSSSYTLPTERVGITLPDGTLAIAAVPHGLVGLKGDLVSINVYHRKITKTPEYRLSAIVERAKGDAKQ